MMCAETLTKSGVFHELLGHFPRDTPGDLVMESLSNAALLYMELTLRDRIEASADPQLALFSGSLFIEDGLLSSRDAKFLIGLLWKSRSSIIPLRSEELLPGLTVLMLVLSQLTSVHVPVQQLDPQWLRIQDISLRCYLACLVIPQGIETTKERYILQRINQHIFELFSNLEIWTTYDVWFYVDENDARTVVKIRPGFDNLVPRVLPTSLGFLQKEIDKDLVNPIPEGTRETIRLITRAMFEMIGMFSASTPPPTIEVQDAILEALLQSDLYGIIGRIIMFITRETGRPLSRPFD
ncbi:hypothetical protein FRC11_005302 [Ceratobasidium sp. 423]|nr:hypothetical protein FRC11_005302 [Ceratobasidium sp. 423]